MAQPAQNPDADPIEEPVEDTDAEGSEGSDGGIEAYDLTQSRNLSGGMPGLEILGERFAMSFRRTLASALRLACDIQPVSVELITFRDFIMQVPRPTGLFVFQLPPLPGGCAVVLDGQLLISLVDALCGGPEVVLNPEAPSAARDLTRIELQLLGRLAPPIVRDLAHAWEPIMDLEPDFNQIVIRPELSRLADEPETVVFAVFELVVGEFRSPLAMILPMATIEPVRTRLMRVSQVPGHVRNSQPGQRLVEHIPEIPLTLDVELGRTTIDVQTLLSLKEGDVIRLNNRADGPLTASVEGHSKFRGVPEAEGSTMTFRINERVLEEPRS